MSEMSSKVNCVAVLLQSLEGGGAQRRVIELANGFVSAGRKVDLFLVDPKGDLREQLAPEVRIFSADRLPSYLREDPPGALLSGAAAVHPIAVRSLPPERRFPLVLRASSHPYRNLPWTMPGERLVERIRRRRRMKCYAAADFVIAVAADVAEPLRKAFPHKPLTIIPNQVITDEFLAGAAAPIRFPWPDQPGIPLILGIGRLALAKDFPTLIRAFALLRKVRPARLAILGNGSAAEQQGLIDLATRLHIEQDFWLAGDCDHVAAWLSRAQLFVLSSLWEGSPATLIEALSMGCPVVASEAVGTAREILSQGELGSLVPPGRPRLMADAMARELDRGHDKERLRAASEPYRRDRTNDYLEAIDHSAELVRARGAALSVLETGSSRTRRGAQPSLRS